MAKSGKTLIEELVEKTDELEGLCEQIRDAAEEIQTLIDDLAPRVKAVHERF